MIKAPRAGGEASVGNETDCAYWRSPLAETLAGLNTGAQGLTTTEAASRLAQYGPNDATAEERPPPWKALAKKFANPLVLILLAASGLSAATGDVASFLIIFGVVALSVALDFVQESRAQSAVDALRAQVALRADVTREGKTVSLLVADLVPGDWVSLAAGDLVPADGVLVSAAQVFVNQAILTGESFPVEKRVAAAGDPSPEAASAQNAILAGGSVVSGAATMVVCATGARTRLGQIAGALTRAPPPNAFEIGLRRFSLLILRITVVLVLLVLGESLFFHRPWLQSLVFALALAVGLTPELLPMIMTVTLARGAVRMARQKVVVKVLPAIHNLGAMDVLCTDKTGTLTQAQIALTDHIGPDGLESAEVLTLAWLNSHFQGGLRSPLDGAILAKTGIDAAPWRKIDEAPFDFNRRRVSVLLEGPGDRTLIAKGAPEDILKVCTAERIDGSALPLTPERRAALEARFHALGAEGFRLLGVASLGGLSDRETIEPEGEAGLVFAGFAVFNDPPKASAKAALAALLSAGVEVKVLTGDDEAVARHVCAELSFDAGECINGPELAHVSEEALIQRLPRTRLFCRVTPQQKLRILLALKKTGATTGFMGDGVNDAPALHAADVGVSVDSAADVAKAAAEIILLEQDLNVVHAGVLEGRRTIVNTGKYILMASSANFGNIFSMVLAGLILPFLPLLPIQVLLTNLLYDVAQLGLPLDRVDDEAIARPIHWDIRLIERFMMVMGPISTVFDLMTFAVLMLIFRAGEPLFRTGWFVESLLTQILMIFAVRTRRSLFASRPGGVVTALALGGGALTLALPFLPFVARWFQLTPPPASYYVWLGGLTCGFLAATEAAKRAFYRFVAPPLTPSGPQPVPLTRALSSFPSGPGDRTGS